MHQIHVTHPISREYSYAMRTCSISGCERIRHAKGFCAQHYRLNNKYGTPTPTCWCGEFAHTNGGRRGFSDLCKKHTLIKRFWEYVDIKGEDECWEWTGSKTAAGYGNFYWETEMRYAHRISVELDDRAIPDGWYICHKCDNPPCVNPSHLFVGTPKDNVWDKVGKGRDLRGENHPFAKLTNTEVEEIRKLASEGMWQADLARTYNVTPGHISDIVLGLKRRSRDKE